MNSRVKTDVIKLVDTLPIILDDSRSTSTIGRTITVQQVASGISDRSSGLDGFCLDVCQRKFLGLSGFGCGGLVVVGGVGSIEGTEVGLDSPWTVDSGLCH